jgi:hypothetical protein
VYNSCQKINSDRLTSTKSPSTDERIAASTNFVALLVAIFVTLVLIVISVPPMRDVFLTRLDSQSLNWLAVNRVKLIPWVDWLRIVFEVALALFVSNQVFNEQLRSFFENSLDKLKTNLTNWIEDSVERDETRAKIKRALDEIVAFMFLPTNIRELPSDVAILLAASTTIYSQVRRGIPFLFVRLLALRILGAFSGKLHGTAALLAFWGVLLTKVLKLYLEAQILLG